MSTLHSLVEAAVQAPTGDNCQPWIFSLQENELSLTYDHKVAASVFNVRDVPTQLALGAAWENMVLRAGQLGLCATGVIKTDSSGADNSGPHPTPQLKLELRSDPDGKEDPLAQQIFCRRTNRRPYARRALADAALQGLQDCASSDVGVHILAGKQASALVPLVSQCDRLRWEHAPLIRELFSKVRFSPVAKYASRTGLAYDTLGVGSGPLAFMHWLSRGRRAERLGPVGLSLSMAVQTRLLLQRSSALVLITCQPEQVPSIVAAGRAMQRVWLTATAHGVSLQPLAAVPLLCLRSLWNEDQAFSAQHRALLKKLLERWQHLSDKTDGRYALMVFRAGYGPLVAPALRKPVSAFVAEGVPHEQ